MIAVVPAPVFAETRPGTLVLGPGTAVVHPGGEVGEIVQRFCAAVERRSGTRLVATAGTATPPAGSCVRVELGEHSTLARLPAATGRSPVEAGLDERYSIEVEPDGVVTRAPAAAGIARALTTLEQLTATVHEPGAGAEIGCMHIADAPALAWRELSVDVARTAVSLDELRRLVDLAALYKLSVLHLHLTDDQAWRVEAGRPAERCEPDGSFYADADLVELAAYAQDRCVTIVPEIDFPGHARALVELRPELASGRNEVAFEIAPGLVHAGVWLDPDHAPTYGLVDEVLGRVASVFPGSHLHIGGDEPFGMPADAYRRFVEHVVGHVGTLGKRTVGWQETVRAGVDASHVMQYWISPAVGEAGLTALEALSPELTEVIRANLARSRSDVERARRLGVAAIVTPQSHAYLDVPYAEASDDPAQESRRGRVGLRVYPPTTVEQAFGWDPRHALDPGQRPEDLAGAGAALWCETVDDFDDLTFLLLPRLAGTAQKAWGRTDAETWAMHRERLAAHGRLWDQDGLTWFRSPGIDWSA